MSSGTCKRPSPAAWSTWKRLIMMCLYLRRVWPWRGGQHPPGSIETVFLCLPLKLEMDWVPRETCTVFTHGWDSCRVGASFPFPSVCVPTLLAALEAKGSMSVESKLQTSAKYGCGTGALNWMQVGGLWGERVLVAMLRSWGVFQDVPYCTAPQHHTGFNYPRQKDWPRSMKAEQRGLPLPMRKCPHLWTLSLLETETWAWISALGLTAECSQRASFDELLCRALWLFRMAEHLTQAVFLQHMANCPRNWLPPAHSDFG